MSLLFMLFAFLAFSILMTHLSLISSYPAVCTWTTRCYRLGLGAANFTQWMSSFYPCLKRVVTAPLVGQMPSLIKFLLLTNTWGILSQCLLLVYTEKIEEMEVEFSVKDSHWKRIGYCLVKMLNKNIFIKIQGSHVKFPVKKNIECQFIYTIN